LAQVTSTTPTFSALRCGPIVLHLITKENLDAVRQRFADHSDAEYLPKELNKSYVPRYDENGRRTKWGFYAVLDDEVAGLSLLGISSWERLSGYTGADTLTHMRGRGVAPGSKRHLFYLGFALLGLNRIETGCSPANVASRRAIEKVPGFVFEGVLRENGRTETGDFEDELRYAILRRDWSRLYNASTVELIE